MLFKASGSGYIMPHRVESPKCFPVSLY